MRRIKQLQKLPFNAPDVSTQALPAPTDGWDAISSRFDMPPNRAGILTNFVCRPGWSELREGASAWSQNLGGLQSPVETLAALRTPTADHLVAASGGSIFDVTFQGQGNSLASGFTSNRWQYTNFTPPNGTTVIQLVNGSDNLQMWDGTTWSAPSITGFPNSWTTANIVNVFGGKQRLWYTMKNSTICAFMPIGNITGPIAGYQDLGTLFSKGGYLQAVADWTIDGGEGPNTYTAFISSMGQVAVYQGVDPTNTALWAFIGTLDLAKPIGYRCILRYGSDLLLITYQGVIPVSQALPFDPSADRSASISARIQNQMNLAVQQWGMNFGWQLVAFPLQTLLILNVPQSVNATQVQYVMNTLNFGWSQLTGWNANCFEIATNGAQTTQQLYYGDNTGNVWWAYQGGADGITAIAADMQTAFNWFGQPGRNKRVSLIQPLLVASGNVIPTVGMDVDFGSNAPVQKLQSLGGGSTWGTMVWGQGTWATGLMTVNNFLSAQQAVGKALAVRMGVSVLPSIPQPAATFDHAVFDTSTFDAYQVVSLTLQVNAFNVVYELGGLI